MPMSSRFHSDFRLLNTQNITDNPEVQIIIVTITRILELSAIPVGKNLLCGSQFGTTRSATTGEGVKEHYTDRFN
jgi:hypothetical protein